MRKSLPGRLAAGGGGAFVALALTLATGGSAHADEELRPGPFRYVSGAQTFTTAPGERPAVVLLGNVESVEDGADQLRVSGPGGTRSARTWPGPYALVLIDPAAGGTYRAEVTPGVSRTAMWYSVSAGRVALPVTFDVPARPAVREVELAAGTPVAVRYSTPDYHIVADEFATRPPVLLFDTTGDGPGLLTGADALVPAVTVPYGRGDGAVAGCRQWVVPNSGVYTLLVRDTLDQAVVEVSADLC